MHSVCPHDCPSCCSLEVDVVDGRIADVTGTPGHPFTQGVICGKVREYAERVHSPLRVLTPLRRVGAKGEGRFARISWDDALAEIARRWRAIVAEHGAEAILPFSYAGSMGQVQFHAGHPLFHALGASRLDRSICVSTAYTGWRATVGQVTGNDSEQMVGADLVVLWGVNAAYSTINVMTLVKQARQAGAHVVVIDPYRTPTAVQGDEHLPVRPGSDGALALAVMHVLIGEGLVDGEYVERATLGFDALAEHVKAWPPERVAPLVGLDGSRHGAAGEDALRVLVESGRRVSEPDAGPARARPRGPLHGGARAGDDGHRALRRPRAAGDDVDGARGPVPLVRPLLLPVCRAGDRPAGRGAIELGRLRRAGAGAGRGHGSLRARPRRGAPERARRRSAARQRHHARAAQARTIGAAGAAAALHAVRGGRADAVGQGRVRLRVARRAGPARAADVGAARRGSAARRARRAVSAAVHRPAEPLLPELVVQPVGAAAAPAVRDGDRHDSA